MCIYLTYLHGSHLTPNLWISLQGSPSILRGWKEQWEAIGNRAEVLEGMVYFYSLLKTSSNFSKFHSLKLRGASPSGEAWPLLSCSQLRHMVSLSKSFFRYQESSFVAWWGWNAEERSVLFRPFFSVISWNQALGKTWNTVPHPALSTDALRGLSGWKDILRGLFRSRGERREYVLHLQGKKASETLLIVGAVVCGDR